MPRSARSETTTPRRKGFRAQLKGLTWWQAGLALLPYALVFVGGAIGGAIGGGAMVANLSIARKNLPTAAKAVSMICVCALAYGAYTTVAAVIWWLFHSPSTSSPTATATATALPAGTPHILPPGDGGWTPRTPTPPGALVVDPPSVIHATGAELTWPAYVNTSGKAADDLAGYEVHRGTSEDLKPSAPTLLASLPPGTRSFVDSTALASSNPLGQDNFYLVAVRTRSGALIPGAIRMVWLPPTGRTEIVLPADAATMLSSARPRTAVGGAIRDGMGRPKLEVGADNRGYGRIRTIFDFGAPSAVPRNSVVVNARLSVWGLCHQDYTLHALTRSFVGPQATWTNAAAGAAWARPGGDYAGPAGTWLGGDGADPRRCDFDATAIVRRWIRSPATEHGLLLKAGDETPAADERAFFTGMDGDPGLGEQHLGLTSAWRPALVIIYS